MQSGKCKQQLPSATLSYLVRQLNALEQILFVVLQVSSQDNTLVPGGPESFLLSTTLTLFERHAVNDIARH